MKAKKIYATVIFIIIICLYVALPVEAKMIKEACLGVFRDAPTQEEGERFYLRYHGPEITRLAGPWLSSYQLWLPYEPPKEAVERFGAVRGRYAELWHREEDHSDMPAGKGITPPPWLNQPGFTPVENSTVVVPANPTEEFYDSDPHPEKTTIVRWVTIFRYPEDVSAEDGEEWFLEVHSKEALKQPGLLKFVSHKVMSFGNAGSNDGKTRSWVRLCEYWYKDLDAWRKAVLESPPKYTAPSWGGQYPFVEMMSTFIPYYSDIDFLKGDYTIR